MANESKEQVEQLIEFVRTQTCQKLEQGKWKLSGDEEKVVEQV